MPPPALLPRLGGVLGGVTAAAKPPNLFNCPLLSIGLGSSPSSSSTSSRSSRCFSSNAEQSSRSRRWWSDEAQFDDDDDEFEEDEEDEEEGSSFGGSATWDQVLDEPWFTKMLRAYGYVLPMILVSMLVATGPQAFLLAMAIPLAQSAVSFAIRVFSNTFGRRDQEEYDDDHYSDYRSSGWEEPEYSNSSSSSTRYNGSSSSRSQQPCAKDDKSEDSEPKGEPDDTDSANRRSNDVSKNGSSTGFGGWDELDAGDDQYRNSRSRSSSSSRQSAGPSPAADTATTGGGGRAARSVRRSMRRPQPETATRRRRSGAAARYRQSPLFMRLLVALFPFLGSWFRIML